MNHPQKGRNIFTLGDFHLKKKRSNSENRQRVPPKDPFERDPFKVQSFNFHYAERPVYPVRPVRQRQPEISQQQEQFNTFFYNQDFASSPNLSYTSRDTHFGSHRASGGKSPSKYQESRRRRFLHNSLQNDQHSSLLGPMKSSYPSTSNGRSYMQYPNKCSDFMSTSIFGQSSHDYDIDSYKSKTNESYWNPENDSQRNLMTSSKMDESRNQIMDYTDQGSHNMLRTAFADMCNCLGTQSDKTNENRPVLLRSKTNLNLNSSGKMNSSIDNLRATGSPSRFMESKENREPSNMPSMMPHNNLFKSKPSYILSSTLNSLKPHKSGVLSSVDDSKNFCMKRKLNTNSGCEININIRNLHDNSMADNLTIKIERDPLDENNDGCPAAKKMNQASAKTQNYNWNIKTNSATSITIDKMLSKFGVGSMSLRSKNNSNLSLQDKKSSLSNDNPLEKSLKERTKNLNSIYGPKFPNSVFRKSMAATRKAPSPERIPSLVPWSDNEKFQKNRMKSTTSTSSQNRSKLNLPYLPKTLQRLSKYNNSPMDALQSGCKISSSSTNKVNNICNNINNESNNFKITKYCKNSLKLKILQKFHRSKKRERPQPNDLATTNVKYCSSSSSSPVLPPQNSITETDGGGQCNDKSLMRTLSRHTLHSIKNKINWSKLPMKINMKKVKVLKI